MPSNLHKLILIFYYSVAFLLWYHHHPDLSYYFQAKPNVSSIRIRTHVSAAARRDPIHVAAVCCALAKETRKTQEELLVTMVKSLIISMETYKDVDHLNLHLFTSDKEQEASIGQSLEEFGTRHLENISVQFYSVRETLASVLPPEHYSAIKSDLCGWIRIFFPQIFPNNNVTGLLYLDTDSLVTGSLRQLWGHLGAMSSRQVIAVGRNNEAKDTHFRYLDTWLFSNIPHVPPKGVNAGILAMNLSRMMEVGWVGTCMRTLANYSARTNMDEQRLINVVLHDNPQWMLLLPCQYNFMHVHCDRGLSCDGVLTDPVGIQLVHGAGGQFRKMVSPFRKLYLIYAKFQFGKGGVSSSADIQELFQDVWTYYVGNVSKFSCRGRIGKYLFKQFIVED